MTSFVYSCSLKLLNSHVFSRPDTGSGPSQSDQKSSEPNHALMTDTGSEMQLAISNTLRKFYDTYPGIAITEIEIELKEKYNDYIIEIKGMDEEREYEVKAGLTSLDYIEQKVKPLKAHKQGGVGLRREAMDLKSVKSFDEMFELARNEVQQGEFIEGELELEGNMLEWKFVFRGVMDKHKIKIDAETGIVIR